MKIIRYRRDGHSQYGALDDDGRILPLAGSPFDLLQTVGSPIEQTGVRILAPVQSPRIFCVGLNYAAHAAETGRPTPTRPMLFMKPTTTVIGPDDEIVYPRQGENVHHECELAVIIGRAGRRIAETEALDHVLGYTCGNDISARVIQREEMAQGALLIGKAFDTFCPLGPAIVTDLDPTRVDVMTRVNGEEQQHANTSDLIFPVARLIAYLSDAMTLLPGDVIMTGTPSGVGPISPGDVVEIEIPEIGVLRNPVVAEQ